MFTRVVGLKSLVLDEEVVLKIALQKTDQILDDELVEWLNEFCDKKLVGKMMHL